MEVTRHFTVSIFIVHNAKVLLHQHKKLKLLLPVGGHIDRDELPEDAAFREAKEEAGLDITLYNPDPHFGFKEVKQLIRPQMFQLQDINQFHQHIDAVYFATSNTDHITPGKGETEDIKWYSHEELMKSKAPMSVKLTALDAITLLG